MGTDDGDGEKTFTRSEVRRMIAAEVSKVTERYADYDELKKAADAAGKNQDKIDQVLEKLTAAEKRAEAAELKNTRREVADELGLTAKEARRLSGKTREELLADGRDMIEDLGIDVEARRKGKSAPAGNAAERGQDGENGNGNEGDGGNDGEQDDEGKQQAPRTPRGRPRETLRSGAPGTREEPEETDPLKLVAGVPRR